jgi:hypothetical protein
MLGQRPERAPHVPKDCRRAERHSHPRRRRTRGVGRSLFVRGNSSLPLVHVAVTLVHNRRLIHPLCAQLRLQYYCPVAKFMAGLASYLQTTEADPRLQIVLALLGASRLMMSVCTVARRWQQALISLNACVYQRRREDWCRWRR